MWTAHRKDRRMKYYWEAFYEDFPPVIGESQIDYLERFYEYLREKGFYFSSELARLQQKARAVLALAHGLEEDDPYYFEQRDGQRVCDELSEVLKG